MATLQDLLTQLQLSSNPPFTAYDATFLAQAATLQPPERLALRVEVKKLIQDLDAWDAQFREIREGFGPGAEKTWRKALRYNSKGELVSHAANATLILCHDERWKKLIGFNELTQREVSTRPPPWGHSEIPGGGASAGPWTDLDDVRLSYWLLREYELNLSSRQVSEVVQVVAQQNAFHPVRDYLTSLSWDGTARLNTWLRDYLHVTQENEEYVQRISAWSLMGAVARALMPGCQLDYVLTLIGDQGLNKSSVIRALSPEKSWVMTHDLKLDSKDALQDLLGKWIVELAEIDSMSKYDQGKVKSFVTKPIDTYRRSYGRRTSDVPRQCVFFATGNEGQFLHDITGGRRWWPVTCEQADLRGLLSVRDQLWAEAYFRVAQGEQYWPEPAEERALFAPEQEARRIGDPWEGVIYEFLEEHRSDPDFTFTINDILTRMSRGSDAGESIHSWTKSDQTRIGQILHRFGCVRIRSREGGTVVSRYFRPKLSDSGHRNFQLRKFEIDKSDTNDPKLSRVGPNTEVVQRWDKRWTH